MSDESLVVLPRRAGTGTPFGSSYHSDMATCPKRVLYNTIHREIAESVPADDGDSDRKLIATLVGSIFHGLAQAYHDPAAAAIAVVNQDSTQSLEELEAKRLFDGYALAAGREEWGKCVASERYLPRATEEFALLRAAGIANATAQPDLVTYLTDEQCAELEAKWNAKQFSSLHLPGEGYYMVDYKTAASRSKDHFAVQRWGHQYPLYMYLWNIAVPTQPLRGTIIAHIFKLKEPDIQATFTPYPDAAGEEAVRQLIALVRRRGETEIGQANFSACLSGYGCKWAKIRGPDGRPMCNKLNATEEEIELYNTMRPVWAPEAT